MEVRRANPLDVQAAAETEALLKGGDTGPAVVPGGSYTAQRAGRTGNAAPRDGGTSPSTMMIARAGSLVARSATGALAEL